MSRPRAVRNPKAKIERPTECPCRDDCQWYECIYCVYLGNNTFWEMQISRIANRY